MINITIAGDLGSGKSTVANHLINNPSGTVVEIKGKGFARDASKMKVLFDNRTADILSVEESSLYVVPGDFFLNIQQTKILKQNIKN